MSIVLEDSDYEIEPVPMRAVQAAYESPKSIIYQVFYTILMTCSEILTGKMLITLKGR
jgi:hypothetical protein